MTAADVRQRAFWLAENPPASPSEAWDAYVGQQSVEEWLYYGGPTTPDAIAADHLTPGSGAPFPIDDPDERLRVAGLLAAYIADATP